jgi:hypothetical protein
MNDHVDADFVEMITQNENKFGFITSPRVTRNGANS